MKKILFLFPYPDDRAGSQRFRFEQYLSLLEKSGYELKLEPFLDEPTWNILYKPGHLLEKTLGILKGFMRRFRMLWYATAYEWIFIHREAAPLGPPLFEWFLAKVLKRKIIFDFDDAIWLPNTSEQNKIAVLLKWPQKIKSVLGWSYRISAGNAYLAAYARQFNKQVIVNPTTLDTENHHKLLKDHTQKPFVIGWTGTHSTLLYLTPLIPIIRDLESEYNFVFLVICNTDPGYTLKSYQYLPWNKETEINDLLRLNVGLMSLTDDAWARGKCGFKALQYMSLGIPALVSPVGVNTEIVENEVNGYVCHTSEEWKEALIRLLESPTLCTQMGKAARERIVRHYSVIANSPNFLSLFD
jgi:glycosyltransferase involved in cell wall biosynthesis